MNKYAETLKNLFNFTRIKFIILANETGYNLSYISKWNNGTKLPSPKNIYRINEIASNLFGEEIVKNNRVSAFFVEFNIPLPENSGINCKNIIVNSIADMLNSAYAEATGKSNSESNENTYIVIGNSEVRGLLHDTFTKESITNNRDFFEILISFTVCLPLSEYILELIDKTRHMNVKIGIDKNEFKNDVSEKMYHMYRIFSQNPRINIELYSNENFKNLNLIIAKNIFLMNFSMDKDSVVQLLTLNKSSSNVQKAYKLFNRALNHENLILRAVDNMTMDSTRYRAGFYSGDHFNFLSVYGFEFLLPPKVIEKIADKAYKETNSAASSLSIRKLQIEWEENFQTKHICFFMFKSSLLKYLEDGKLVYSNTRYRTNIDERLEHIDYALNMMKANPKIEFYIIDETKIKKIFNNFSIGVYANNSKMFLKNYQKIFENVEPFISIAMDSYFIKATNAAFEDLKTLPICKKYNAQELEETWQRHKTMFLRIMQINEDNN